MMFAATKIKKPVIIVFIVVHIVILLTVVFFASSANGEADAAFSVQSPADITAFLKEYGWKTDVSPAEVCETRIPERLDRVFENYNELQLTQGFDLTEYAGKTVTRYSFIVTNYPDVAETVRANVLVSGGTIIGGDICTLRPDGFMHGFKPSGTGETNPAFFQTE